MDENSSDISFVQLELMMELKYNFETEKQFTVGS